MKAIEVGDVKEMSTALRGQGVLPDTSGVSTSSHLRLIHGIFDGSVAVGTAVKQMQ